MARVFGRILSRIWDDKDFLELEPTQQRLYCFLLSQSNLNHAGLLPLTMRKWAKKAKGLTVAAIRNDLGALDAARFVVVDEDTEELLIRSFVRNDEVWKQPRVMGAMVSGAQEIESHRLRRVLLAEMDRIPLHLLLDEPAKLRNGTEGPSIRMQVREHIDALRLAFADLDPDPQDDMPEPLPNPLAEGGHEGGIEGGHEGDTEEGRQGSGDTRAGAGPRARALPLPLPLQPAPTTSPSPSAEPTRASGPHTQPPPWPPAELVPLIDGLAAEGLVVDWNLSLVQADKVRAAIDRCGTAALIAYALRRHRPDNPAFSARAWIDGWASLPALSTDAPLAPVVDINRGSSGDLGGDEHIARFLARQKAKKEQVG